MKKGQVRRTYSDELKAEALAAFKNRPRGVFVEDIEKQFGLPKNSIYRFARSLKKSPGQGAISSSRSLSKVQPLDEAETFGRTYQAIAKRTQGQGDLFNVADLVAELNPPAPDRSDKNAAKIARLEKENAALKEDLRLLQDIARHAIKRGVLGLLPPEEG